MVDNFQIIERGENNTVLTWSVNHSGKQLMGRVLRSDGRFGPFEPISGWLDLFQTERFEDGASTQHRYRRWYYKLEVKDEDGVVRVFPNGWPLSTEFRGDRVANAMAGDTDIYYKVHGREVIYFPVRTFGGKCPACYDAITSKKLKAGCEVCWDTGFVDGYLTPVRVHVILEFENRQQSKDVGITGSTIRARFPWWVDLRPDSVVVEHENQRWRVAEPIQQVVKRRVLIWQSCILAELPYGRIEWKLPVPDVIAEPVVGWRYS